MKGTIAKCVAEMVTEKFGKDKWEEILVRAGLPKDARFLPSQDLDDGAVMKVVEALCQTLNITPVQAADAFGEYWATVYAPKYYQPIYNMAPDARTFLLNMDGVHDRMTKSVPGAHPPHFEYEWKGDKTLIMKYYSPRGMVDFVAGLAKGVGKYYHQPLRVRKTGNDQVEIVFP